MKKVKRSMVLAAVALALILTGCGGAVVMKEFTSADETVSIQMSEKWTAEDMGAGSEGWVAAANANGSDAVIVMQLPKNVYGTIDMDDWQDLINNSYAVSGAETIENPSVPGMEVVAAYSCAVTADGVKGEGRILYGETDYAYYNILYVALKINAAKTEYFNNVCASFQENAPEMEDLSTIDRTDTVQWFNNTCAVLTAVNSWDYTLFGGAPANDSSKAIVQNMLNEWWDVTDHESADETMDWLLNEGQRVSFAEELGCGEDDVAGWDYCRAMSLLGYYYLAGYYTEEEALDQSLEVAKTIQNTFDSWDSLMDSYFAGYEYWSEDNSGERREIYEGIKAEADSPFNLDWGMTLEKSW